MPSSSFTESPIILTAFLLTVAVAALVWSEVKGFRPGVWIAKPLASTVFVGTALVAGALGSGYGRLVLLALVLSWLGDVLLIPNRQVVFVTGLGSFLLAHLAFGGAFLLQPREPLPLALAAVGMAVFGAGVLRWLWPYLTPKLRPAVAAYVVAISLMVAVCWGAVSTLGVSVAIAAIAFAVSDVLVARHRFVAAGALNKILGLPLYYAAQLLFAWSVVDG